MHIRHTLPLLALCILCGCGHHTAITARNPPPPPIPAPPPPPEPAEIQPPPPPPEPAFVYLGHPTAAANPMGGGQLYGIVTDTTGATISGSTVRAISATGVSNSAITNSVGQYNISGLSAGTYTLTFTSTGFQVKALSGIVVSDGQASSANATLAVGEMGMDAMVTAAAPPSTRERVDTWYKHLPNGTIKYFSGTNNGKMVLMQTYTATATIYPPGMTPPPDTSTPGVTSSTKASPAAAQAAAARQPLPLAISTWMRVSLTQPDNPGAFEITPAIGPCLYVSMVTPTPWSFQVKPLQGGGNKTLVFTAYVVYGDDAASCPQGDPATFSLPANRQTVHIQEVSFKKLKQEAEDSFWQDPLGWFKKASNAVRWGFPGGAGFIAISSFFAWWKKRKKAGASK